MGYTQGYHDIHVIPDKYNTGIDIEKCVGTYVAGETLSCGLITRVFTTDDTARISFRKAPNVSAVGEYLIENIDFKSSGVNAMGICDGSYYTGDGITIKYINCKFVEYIDNDHDGADKIQVEFYNCSFERFYGSNATFYNCFFGEQGAKDPLNPTTNCTFNDCYIADVCRKADTQGAGHVDGMQTQVAKNLYFNNCRWEVPSLNYSITEGGMNVAIFIQPQDTAENIIFNNCHINGGGYFTFALSGDETTFSNVSFNDTFVGYCYKSGAPFDEVNDFTESIFSNTSLHDSLYVSSVWKDDLGFLHFVTSNDTGEDRTLSVVTNLGTTTYEIPRTYKATEYEVDTKDFEDLPIDLEYVIEQTDIKYAVFYESDAQIRYVNFGGDVPAYESISELFKDICNAIREKNGSTSLIKHIDIPEIIRNL